MDEFISPMDEEPNQNCNDKMNTHLHPNHIKIASSMEGVQKVKGITLVRQLQNCLVHIGKKSYMYKVSTMTLGWTMVKYH
jgi:hypothetical protein